MSVDIKNFTRGNVPYKDLPLCAIKEKILGKNYELSLAFVGDTRSKNLNKKYRGKDKPTNILSFELSKTSGEIIMNPRLVKSQASKFNRSYKNFLAFLFIHGLYHLEGMQHGSIMEEAEKKIRKIYNI